MKKKNIIIPIEIKSREIEGAIYLANEALKKGWRVIIGQKQQIWPFIKVFSPSFFYLKSIVPSEKQNLTKIKDANHLISSLDIEGLVLGREPLGIVRRFSKETISLADIIFYWGTYQYEKVKKIFPQVKSKSVITGSPVVDSWKKASKKFDVKKDRKNILISMNFARSDPRLTKVKYLVEKKTFGKLRLTKKQMKIFNNEYSLKKVSFNQFIEMTKYLAENLKKYNIIVRPHPEENILRYNFLKNYKNISIDNKTDRVKQLKRSNIFIHFNSTMSVQAKYLNNKVIMYNPINDKDMLDVLSPVPMNISLNAKNLKQLLFFIKNNKEIKSRINFNKLLANYKNSTAAKNIIQSLEKYIKNKNIRIEDYPSKLFSFISMFYYLKFKSNLYVSILLSYVSIIMPFLRDKFSNRRYHNYMYKIKWPGLKKIELIELFNNLNKNNDVKNKYSIKKHYSGFFIIE